VTEPLTGAKLAEWEAMLPGAKSRQALTLLADESTFLDAPGAKNSATSAPDIDEQRQMLTFAVDYVKGVQSRLPNFTATRKTLRFLELMPVRPDGRPVTAPYLGLHAVGESLDTLLYRDGKEVVDAPDTAGKARKSGEPGLETHGVFGPMLGIVIADAIHGRLGWSRWEQDATEPEAVFHFAVPQSKSHYQVWFCCFVSSSAAHREFRQNAAYHGEIALDPATGTVLRLSIVADMGAEDPIRKSSIEVEYGPVVLGGKSYICPLRSVSMQVEWERGTAAFRTSLNDATFSDYHRFGAESRVLTGEEGEVP
jgi:hypothetical protein